MVGGKHLCEIKGQIDLESLARDGRIIWSEQAFELRLTNAVAGAIVGVLYQQFILSLDGSGENLFHRYWYRSNSSDLTGRIAGVYTQFGLILVLRIQMVATERMLH